MFIYMIVFIILLVILAKLKSPQYKGKCGENIINQILQQMDGYKYVLNDIMINDNGKSRQIDHIFVSEYGVFVIETKNYAGAIYGKEKIDEIYITLNDSKITNEEVIKNHNYNVQKYVEYKENIAKGGKCPRCNGDLIERHGKNGPFYGCSNYPKCRYTKNK